MQRQTIILLNLIPYALFSIFGFMAILLDYFFGKSYSLFATNLLWSYFAFPLLLFWLNMSHSNNRKLSARILIAIGAGLLFLVVGYLLLLLFVKTRMDIGLDV